MLSVDKTIVIQFVFFIISYIVLSRLIFRPYLERYYSRKTLTDGHEDQAQKLLTQHKDMEVQYEQKVRQVGVHLKTIMDEVRQRVSKQYDEIVDKAKGQAEKEVWEVKNKLCDNYPKLKEEVFQNIPELSKIVVKKILNKENVK